MLAFERKKHKDLMNEQKLYFARKINNIRNSQSQPTKTIQDEFFCHNEFDEVLSDSKKNYGLKNGKRYSSPSKAFWTSLHTFSKKAFYMMKEYLDGPYDSTISEWIKNDCSIPKCQDLEDTGQISRIIDFWIRKFEIPSDANYTISNDAAKIDENLSIDYNAM